MRTGNYKCLVRIIMKTNYFVFLMLRVNNSFNLTILEKFKLKFWLKICIKCLILFSLPLFVYRIERAVIPWNMKLFQSTLKFYGLIGLQPPSESNQDNCAINCKNSVFLLCLIPSIVSTFGYFLFKAETAIEHAQTF